MQAIPRLSVAALQNGDKRFFSKVVVLQNSKFPCVCALNGVLFGHLYADACVFAILKDQFFYEICL